MNCEVIRMAREAGFGIGLSDLYAPALERFAVLVAAAEREAICQLADDMLRGVDALPLIEAIRARGQG